MKREFKNGVCINWFIGTNPKSETKIPLSDGYYSEAFAFQVSIKENAIGSFLEEIDDEVSGTPFPDTLYYRLCDIEGELPFQLKNIDPDEYIAFRKGDHEKAVIVFFIHELEEMGFDFSGFISESAKTKTNTMSERITFKGLNETDPKETITKLTALGLTHAVKDFCEKYNLNATITTGGIFTVIEIDGYSFELTQVDDNLQGFTLIHSGVTFNCVNSTHALQIFKAIIYKDF